MIRELITRFNRSLSEKMVSSRRRHVAPIKVWFDSDIKTELGEDAARAACKHGESFDMSRTGLAFVVPSIRVKEKYLVGLERPLNFEIDLPTGKVRLRAMGKRYEKVGIHISTERFLVGAHILELSGEDKENYELFLKWGSRVPAAATGSLEMGKP